MKIISTTILIISMGASVAFAGSNDDLRSEACRLLGEAKFCSADAKKLPDAIYNSIMSQPASNDIRIDRISKLGTWNGCIEGADMVATGMRVNGSANCKTIDKRIAEMSVKLRK